MQTPRGELGPALRDIRGDLKERADLLERQISKAQADYDLAAARLHHQLRAELAALGASVVVEQYRTFLSDFLQSERIR